jgi:hypothetical protein
MPPIDLSDEVRSFIGKERKREVSPPISLSDIRKWAIAVYWPERSPRLFWDDDYARSTRFGGIVAPEDFNAFGWSVEGGLDPYRSDDMLDAFVRMGIGANVLNGGNDTEYHLRMRPGDVITAVTTVDEIYLREGRLGTMLFTIQKVLWTNQNREAVKTMRHTGIRY